MKDKMPVKPVAEYLINGPIPADELMDIDFLDDYVGSVVDTRLDIHFMLEHVSVHGAPQWWEGTVPEFEQEFHRLYYQRSAGDQEDKQRNQIQAVELLMEMWMEDKVRRGLL